MSCVKVEAKSADAELARLLQAFVLDLMGPLVKLLQGLDNPDIMIKGQLQSCYRYHLPPWKWLLSDFPPS